MGRFKNKHATPGLVSMAKNKNNLIIIIIIIIIIIAKIGIKNSLNPLKNLIQNY
jgi:hypothetical protein